MDKCVHDISSRKHTVNLLPRRHMAVPNTIYGVCICCHQPLVYIKIDGQFVLQEEIKGEENSDK